MRFVGYLARMGIKRGEYRLLVRKPDGKRPLGIPKHRLNNNIKMDLQEMDVGHGLDCSGSG
jgi:hypothetical protein